MSKSNYNKVLNQVFTDVEQGNLDSAQSRVVAALKKLDSSPFHAVLTLEITNKPQEVAESFDTFIQQSATSCTIGAVYAEMNGFDINPDRWFFNIFVYADSDVSGKDNGSFLGDSAPCDESNEIVITGLEELQAVYRNKCIYDGSDEDTQVDDPYRWKKMIRFYFTPFKKLFGRSTPAAIPSKEPYPFEAAAEFATLLVLLKFQNLIRQSAPLMKNVHCPLLATAHDWDVVYTYTKK